MSADETPTQLKLKQLPDGTKMIDLMDVPMVGKAVAMLAARALLSTDDPEHAIALLEGMARNWHEEEPEAMAEPHNIDAYTIAAQAIREAKSLIEAADG